MSGGTELREKVARIIAPEAFQQSEWPEHLEDFTPYGVISGREVREFGQQLVELALSRADAVLALPELAAVPALREALEAARDLLLERTHGNPARSAGHNARLVIEKALALTEGRER